MPLSSVLPAAPAALLERWTASHAVRTRARLVRTRWLVWGLPAFALMWLAVLASTSLVPPVDTVEQLSWVRSLEWGYYKHPPLPTWLLSLPVAVFGLSSLVAASLGAACCLGALALMWRLLVALRGPAYAGVALLAALCITYYNLRLNYYNHNVVLLVLSTAAAWACWRAVATGRARWWAALGLVVGLGLLTKYQMMLTVGSVLVYALHQRAWADRANRRGAVLASAVALAVFAPHLVWLWTNGFPPVRYAMESALGAGLHGQAWMVNAGRWLAEQLLNRALPAWLLLAAAVFSARAGLARRARTPRPSPPARDAGFALIMAWAVVPLVLMEVMSLFSGSYLQPHWGKPFLLFAVPAVMECLPRSLWPQVRLGVVLRGFLLIQAVLLLQNLATAQASRLDPGRHTWREFDAARLAQRLGPAARQELGGPVVLISGPAAWAGALALNLPDRPRVIVDGRFDLSPWASAELARRCGVLEIDPNEDRVGLKPLPGAPLGPLGWRITPREPDAPPCAWP